MSKRALWISSLGVVLVWLAVAGVTVLTLQRAAERDATEFASPNLIEIIEVDSVEHLGQPDIAFSETGSPPTYLPSRQIAERVDTMYLPSYVPDGFALVGSSVKYGPVTTRYSSEHLELSIMQESIPGQPRVKTGHVVELTINGQPAYLVRGGWQQFVKDGVVSPTEWDPEAVMSLMFQIDRYWFLVEVYPDPVAQGFHEEELLRVAESFRLYQ